MTIPARAGVRALTFGDLDGELWGAAWTAGEQASVLLFAGGEAVAMSAGLTDGGQDADWILAGEGIELSASAEVEALALDAEDEERRGLAQLCRVSGTVAIREPRSIDCLGWRLSREHRLDPELFESARSVCAWFDRGEGLSLVSVRPRGAAGQEQDLVSAALVEGGRALTLSDPRLSTTYSASGIPQRVNVELWLGDEEGAEFPRRMAGECEGTGAETSLDGFDFRAVPFRWHTGGKDGSGMYLLARAS